MTTFRLVKLRAYTFTLEQIGIAKQIASKQGNFELFWAFDAACALIFMFDSKDKLFWWRQTVKAIRYSNDFYRAN